jgi:tetratricopeptide (TPR) repeat protein
MIQRFSSIAVVLLFLLIGGCGWFSPGPRHPAITVAPPEGLPEDPAQLLALADDVLETGASIDALVEAVAALEEISSGRAKGVNTPAPFEVEARMARACYLIAEFEPNLSRRTPWLRKGQLAAEQAMRARPDRVEGTYFLAVILGRLAEEMGMSALAMVHRVEELGNKAMELDPTFDNAGPYRLLAMLYAKAPAWPVSIGDIDRALELAQEGVEVLDYPLNRYVLAEVLIEAGEKAQARQELRRVLAAPKAGKWAQEGETWRPRARRLLVSLSKR